MSTITKERLIKIQQWRETYGPGSNVVLPAEEAEELARIALASLEANSRKLFTCSACGAEGLDEPLESKCHCCIDGAHWVESRIYTAPPAPVSDSLLSELLDIAKRAADEADECARAEFSDDSMEHSAAIADWERRAVMLQGAEPVTTTTGYKLPDDFDFDRFNDFVWLETVASNPHMHSPTTSTIAMVALELNRKLAAGNSPVIPDGLRLALSNAGIAAPESDEMLAATCEKHIQALVTWVKDRKPFQPAAPQQEVKP